MLSLTWSCWISKKRCRGRAYTGAEGMTDRESPPTHNKLMREDIMACHGTCPRWPMAPNSPVHISPGPGSSLTPGIMFPDFSKCARIKDKLVWAEMVPSPWRRLVGEKDGVSPTTCVHTFNRESKQAFSHLSIVCPTMEPVHTSPHVKNPC